MIRSVVAIFFLLCCLVASPGVAKPFSGEIVDCPMPNNHIQCRALVIQKNNSLWQFYARNAPASDPLRRWSEFEDIVEILNPGVNLAKLRLETVLYIHLPLGTQFELIKRDVDLLRVQVDSARMLSEQAPVSNIVYDGPGYNLESRLEQALEDVRILRIMWWIAFSIIAFFLAGLYVLYLVWRQSTTRAQEREQPADIAVGAEILKLADHRG